MARVAQLGGRQLTVENVIQSNGNLTLNDVYSVYGISGDIWNVKPALGFYCLYRSADPNAPLPNCTNITQTTTAHAAMLTEAGFDYVAADVTNWPMVDTNGPTDIAVLTPIRTLFEEWLVLRNAGTPTPQIAVWPCSPSGATTWRYLLEQYYNNDTYSSMIYTQNGKKVVFVPYNSNCYDASEVAQIASNGGRNDITVIPMWAMFGPSTFAQGVYGFFSLCWDQAAHAYTTSIVGLPSCNQSVTLQNGTSAVIEVSASGSYMAAQTALPFAAPGKFRGLTIAKLFEKVLTTRAPHLFVSSFNEHIGGRQTPGIKALIAFNQGLPNDPQRNSVWVDTYATEFSRDLEPSEEAGDTVWKVAASCVQLYKRGLMCDDLPPESSACCSRQDKEVFANVWSLARLDGSDYLLTVSSEERAKLLASGLWREQCSPVPYPSAFCVNMSEPDGRAGPFILYNTSDVGAGGVPTVPLYRCLTPSVQHFFSLDPKCEQAGTAEMLLGYVATRPGLEMLRGLHRCRGAAAGTRYQALDLQCDVPDGSTTPLGYVR